MSAEASVISGAVRDSAGKPIPGAVVSLVEGPVSLPDIAALTAADGSFQVSAPTRGTYRVAVHADGFSTETKGVTVKPGAASTVAFRLRPK